MLRPPYADVADFLPTVPIYDGRAAPFDIDNYTDLPQFAHELPADSFAAVIFTARSYSIKGRTDGNLVFNVIAAILVANRDPRGVLSTKFEPTVESMGITYS